MASKKGPGPGGVDSRRPRELFSREELAERILAFILPEGAPEEAEDVLQWLSGHVRNGEADVSVDDALSDMQLVSKIRADGREQAEIIGVVVEVFNALVGAGLLLPSEEGERATFPLADEEPVSPVENAESDDGLGFPHLDAYMERVANGGDPHDGEGERIAEWRARRLSDPPIDPAGLFGDADYDTADLRADALEFLADDFPRAGLTRAEFLDQFSEAGMLWGELVAAGVLVESAIAEGVFQINRENLEAFLAKETPSSDPEPGAPDRPRDAEPGPEATGSPDRPIDKNAGFSADWDWIRADLQISSDEEWFVDELEKCIRVSVFTHSQYQGRLKPMILELRKGKVPDEGFFNDPNKLYTRKMLTPAGEYSESMPAQEIPYDRDEFLAFSADARRRLAEAKESADKKLAEAQFAARLEQICADAKYHAAAERLVIVDATIDADQILRALAAISASTLEPSALREVGQALRAWANDLDAVKASDFSMFRKLSQKFSEKTTDQKIHASELEKIGREIVAASNAGLAAIAVTKPTPETKDLPEAEQISQLAAAPAFADLPDKSPAGITAALDRLAAAIPSASGGEGKDFRDALEARATAELRKIFVLDAKGGMPAGRAARKEMLEKALLDGRLSPESFVFMLGEQMTTNEDSNGRDFLTGEAPKKIGWIVIKPTVGDGGAVFSSSRLERLQGKEGKIKFRENDTLPDRADWLRAIGRPDLLAGPAEDGETEPRAIPDNFLAKTARGAKATGRWLRAMGRRHLWVDDLPPARMLTDAKVKFWEPLKKWKSVDRAKYSRDRARDEIWLKVAALANAKRLEAHERAIATANPKMDPEDAARLARERHGTEKIDLSKWGISADGGGWTDLDKKLADIARRGDFPRLERILAIMGPQLKEIADPLAADDFDFEKGDQKVAEKVRADIEKLFDAAIEATENGETDKDGNRIEKPAWEKLLEYAQDKPARLALILTVEGVPAITATMAGAGELALRMTGIHAIGQISGINSALSTIGSGLGAAVEKVPFVGEALTAGGGPMWALGVPQLFLGAHVHWDPEHPIRSVIVYSVDLALGATAIAFLPTMPLMPIATLAVGWEGGRALAHLTRADKLWAKIPQFGRSLAVWTGGLTAAAAGGVWLFLGSGGAWLYAQTHADPNKLKLVQKILRPAANAAVGEFFSSAAEGLAERIENVRGAVSEAGDIFEKGRVAWDALRAAKESGDPEAIAAAQAKLDAVAAEQRNAEAGIAAEIGDLVKKTARENSDADPVELKKALDGTRSALQKSLAGQDPEAGATATMAFEQAVSQALNNRRNDQMTDAERAAAAKKRERNSWERQREEAMDDGF